MTPYDFNALKLFFSKCVNKRVVCYAFGSYRFEGIGSGRHGFIIYMRVKIQLSTELRV